MSRSLERHLCKDTGPKRILSLSGGGVRGLISLGILTAIETAYREHIGDPDARLCDHYDLIAGTSTGSIIATALALGWSVAEIKDMYFRICPVLFKPTRRMGFWKAKFNAHYLQDILEKELREPSGELIELGSKALRTGLLICAKRMDTDSAWVMTNNPEAEYFNAKHNDTHMPNKYYKLASIVRASASAPSYLDPVIIDVGNTERGYPSEPALFVDGAISGHNCPALIAYQVATLEPYKFNWAMGEDKLSILSIGTGQARERRNVEEFAQMPTYKQALAALTGLIAESQRNVIMTMQALSNPEGDRAWCLNSEIKGLQGHLMTEDPLFKFRHIDACIDNAAIVRDLRLKGRDAKAIYQIGPGVRDMSNGRNDNLVRCEQIGMVAGTKVSPEDLFV